MITKQAFSSKNQDRGEYRQLPQVDARRFISSAGESMEEEAPESSSSSSSMAQDASSSSTTDFEGYEELWRMSLAFVAPLALKVAVSLGIPDILAKSAGSKGSMSLQQIASQLNIENDEYLHRLLRLLVANNVFTETTTHMYSLNKVSRWLVKAGNDFCLAPYLLAHVDAALMVPFEHVREMVLGGEEPGFPFEKTNGGKDIWAYCTQNKAYGELFNEAMASMSKRIIATVLQHYHGFRGVEKIVDVGGGVGLCMERVVAAYPHLRAINYDLPSVVASAPAYPGVEHVGGDMFERVPEADAIFMKAVMHDWDDELCTKILTNCHNALRDGGKLIIVELVVGSGGDRDATAGPVMDVLMLACTKGKERGAEEWKKLLERSRFEDVQIIGMPMPWSVIEASKRI